jgi:uncharacterized protein YecA (UPF0149 family)
VLLILLLSCSRFELAQAAQHKQAEEDYCPKENGDKFIDP